MPRSPIGLAEYMRLDAFDEAELAIVVVDAWQRRGIGSALATALRDRALAAGVRRFNATMFAGNAGAVALAAARGPATRREARLQRFLASAKDIAAGGVGRIDAEPD